MTGLQTATIFSACATKFCLRSHWRDHRNIQFINTAISVAYVKHQMVNETESITKLRYSLELRSASSVEPAGA